MIHNSAQKLTAYIIQRGWITEDNALWCIYVLEKKLVQILFILLLSTVSIVLNHYWDVLIFSITFGLFRRRMGGWHAPKAWLCQLLSLLSVCIAVFVIAPRLEGKHSVFFLVLDIVLLIWGFIIMPVYPPQLHFGKAEAIKNKQKKDVLILILILVQVCSMIAKVEVVFINSFLGLSAGIISVYIEKIKERKEQYL